MSLDCFSARIFMDTTSDPEPASLMARAPTCSPVINLGRYLEEILYKTQHKLTGRGFVDKDSDYRISKA